MFRQKCHEDFWNGPNLVLKAGSMANGYSHKRSIKDKTDHVNYEINVSNLSADSGGGRIPLFALSCRRF